MRMLLLLLVVLICVLYVAVNQIVETVIIVGIGQPNEGCCYNASIDIARRGTLQYVIGDQYIESLYTPSAGYIVLVVSEPLYDRSRTANHIGHLVALTRSLKTINNLILLQATGGDVIRTSKALETINGRVAMFVYTSMSDDDDQSGRHIDMIALIEQMRSLPGASSTTPFLINDDSHGHIPFLIPYTAYVNMPLGYAFDGHYTASGQRLLGIEFAIALNYAKSNTAPGSIPSHPSIYSITAIDINQINVAWTPGPEVSTAPVTGFTISYRPYLFSPSWEDIYSGPSIVIDVPNDAMRTHTFTVLPWYQIQIDVHAISGTQRSSGSSWTMFQPRIL